MAHFWESWEESHSQNLLPRLISAAAELADVGRPPRVQIPSDVMGAGSSGWGKESPYSSGTECSIHLSLVLCKDANYCVGSNLK